MGPRRAFAWTVIGLLLIAGIASLSSVSSGTISVYVRGAPAGWARLSVVFSDIRVHRADAGNESGWISLPLSAPTIDFAALGDLAKMLALDRAPTGKYTQLRIVIDSVNGVLSDGTPVHLLVPDRVLKTTVPFMVPSGGATRVTLGFDLADSIHSAGGKWIFRPVLGTIQVS